MLNNTYTQNTTTGGVEMVGLQKFFHFCLVYGQVVVVGMNDILLK